METWDYMKKYKVWWLAPIIIMILLLSLLMIFGQSNAMTPFIYTLF